MRPLLASSFDIQGGAARAAYRLHNGLIKCGIESRMLVQEKWSDDFNVQGPQSKSAYFLARLRANFDSLPLCLYPGHHSSLFSSAILPDTLLRQIDALEPDIIHLHWVSYGFMRIETLAAIAKPVVWTLHDMWPFTGGCHYSEGCNHYTNACGCCPLLDSAKKRDLSYWNWNRKHRNWPSLTMKIVSPSHWLADCAFKSPLFKKSNIEVIPNGIDLTCFLPRNKHLCRDILSLPQGKKIILCGGIDCKSDKRKGFDLFLLAMRQLRETMSDAEVAVIGMSRPETLPDLDMPIHYLGQLHDDISLSIVYGAADIFVASSREENLSNMVLEAISCGLPCVAFAIGGMSDMIRNGHNGFLASPFDITELAAGMKQILTDDSLHLEMSQHSRQKAEQEFDITLVAGRYSRLYEEAMRVCLPPKVSR